MSLAYREPHFNNLWKNIGLSYKSLYRYIKNLLGSGGSVSQKTSATPKENVLLADSSAAFFSMNKTVAKINLRLAAQSVEMSKNFSKQKKQEPKTPQLIKLIRNQKARSRRSEAPGSGNGVVMCVGHSVCREPGTGVFNSFCSLPWPGRQIAKRISHSRTSQTPRCLSTNQ